MSEVQLNFQKVNQKLNVPVVDHNTSGNTGKNSAVTGWGSFIGPTLLIALIGLD